MPSAAPPRRIVRIAVLLLAAGCAGCAGGASRSARWDGRRGYDGNGDYGYDVAESRSEARRYVTRAARDYPAPGPSGDPWGPHIREAAVRFHVPERWIREVMRQESGGHTLDPDGTPITSSVGAMGLMQVMPRTYDMLRQRYGLGDDPYDPRNSILAGTAYIREMADIYGSPGFLAAYNAGPDRLNAYLSGASSLPDETVNYLASIAPRLGGTGPMTGPLAGYAGRAASPSSAPLYASAVPQGAYAQPENAPADPSDQAFEGGGLVTPDAPTGVLTAAAQTTTPIIAPPEPVRLVRIAALPAGPGLGVRPLVQPAGPRSAYQQPLPQLPVPAPRVLPVGMAVPRAGAWAIQVGAYPDPSNSAHAIAAARAGAADVLSGAEQAIIPVQHAGVLYRARLVGLTADRAQAACTRLSAQGVDCFTVPPGS